jgi:hypothetical protein
VRIVVPGGRETVPKSVLDWGLIQFVATDGIVGESALLIVRIAPSGSPFGVQATG